MVKIKLNWTKGCSSIYMRVRWQFYFEYEDLKFEKTYKYGVQISEDQAKGFGLPTFAFEAILTIEADKEKGRGIRQLGMINIFLPGTGEETEDLAYSLALSLAEQITFSQGKIKLDGSFISNELLPETPEEEAEVGENRFSWNVQLRKVPDQIAFDAASIQMVTNDPLVKQFNDARDAKSAIDQFIGLFKILEDLYGGRPLKSSLKRSAELNEIALHYVEVEEAGAVRQITQPEFEKLVDDLVDVRNQCAHRTPDGFGLRHGDARVQTEVKPLLESLEKLAYEAVQRRISRDDLSTTDELVPTS